MYLGKELLTLSKRDPESLPEEINKMNKDVAVSRIGKSVTD
jgi:hypothetical protein